MKIEVIQIVVNLEIWNLLKLVKAVRGCEWHRPKGGKVGSLRLKLGCIMVKLNKFVVFDRDFVLWFGAVTSSIICKSVNGSGSGRFYVKSERDLKDMGFKICI